MKAIRFTRLLAIFLIAAIAGPSSADVVTFDDDGLGHGTPIGSVTSAGGVTIGIFGESGKDIGGPNWARIFDTNMPTCGDEDLGTPNETCPGGGPGSGAGGELGQPNENCVALNNALIIQELECDGGDCEARCTPNDSEEPFADDSANSAGSLTFDFSSLSQPVTVHTIDFLDVEADEPNAELLLFDGAMDLITTAEGAATEDNGFGRIDVGSVSGVVYVVVDLNGSGAVDNLVFDFCGDGVVDDGEECDDGNNDDGDGCDAQCNNEAFCGDGVVDAGEECDDGNNEDGDGCQADCQNPECGDGVVDAGEECDDGNNDDGDGCQADCQNPECGDGVVDAGEECDDGNNDDGDGCQADCQNPECGDGVVDAGEECDDGNNDDGDGCQADCQNPECGDGVVDAGEECDDGNNDDGDGCQADCQNPECGDGVVDAGEECDDGNNDDGDGCQADCQNPECGDGVVDAGEECDDGNNDDGDGCQADCQNPECGDGVVDAGEECDDGNNDDGDGCQADCQNSECGDGVVDAGEECDDGNNDDGDGCQADCRNPECGDGIVDPGEDCDDGNDVEDDGCQNDCSEEEVLECRMTGGGNRRDDVTKNRYTFGGQAGAPSAEQPQPFGEWTHHQQRGPAKRFVFHAGTHSAPADTEVDLIVCSDPGWCSQARPAPAKQLDFEGVGVFRNIGGNRPPALANVVRGRSRHWFEVHIEDLGEPGSQNGEVDSADCPPDGNDGMIAMCGCQDYYRITIYEAFDPETEPRNQTDVIYSESGYLEGGNFQIHPPVGSP